MKNVIIIFSLLIAVSCGNQTKEKRNNNSKINVKMDIKHYIKNGGVFFDIETNLPDNFKGNMSITNENGEIMGQSQYIVNEGRIKSEKFTIHGKQYPTGKYKLSISSPYPHLQENESIKKLIGKTGQNLIGEHIERRKDDILNEEYSFLDVVYEFDITNTNENENIIGKYIHKKGGGHTTTYFIKNKEDKLFLTTKVNSPSMSEFTSTEELIKKNDKYIRSSEEGNPAYYFKIEDNRLIIYDDMGVYANLINKK